MEVVGFEMLSNRLTISPQVRVSVAHVVVIVDHNSAPLGREVFANEGLAGFDTFTIAILPEGYWFYAGTVPLVAVSVLREVCFHLFCFFLHLDTKSV